MRAPDEGADWDEMSWREDKQDCLRTIKELNYVYKYTIASMK